ncbi:BTAD domain-containing putative transcriptional regulator [Kineosporia sp. A_224]|uniref:AfsR/SARP family transcriptional regulator n=1 Tax=Kineosporia sp. A_224 TaxID=1962180 RepID=UPI00130430A5|nr:BTAD domain-containing putative transcriptional regulator [Kineosporia sp. A_224]
MRVPAGLDLRLLGRYRALRGGQPLRFRSASQVALLAVLADHRGRPVSTETLVAAMWPTTRPDAPVAAVASSVALLVRVLVTAPLWEVGAPGTAPGPVPEWATYDLDVVRTAGGWQLDARAGSVDLERFEADAAEGLRLLRAGLPADAVVRLGEAAGTLGLPVLDGLHGPFDARRAEVEARQLEVAAGYADAALALGLHDDAAELLERATRVFPSAPGLWERLAVAHVRAGRGPAAYRVLDQALRLLGRSADPRSTAALSRLRNEVIAGDPALWSPAAGTAMTPAPGSAAAPAAATLPGTRTPPRPAGPAAAPVSRPATSTRYRVFPRLAVLQGQVEVPLRTPEQRRLLAVLLLRRNTPVPLADVCAGVWGDDPPMKPGLAVDVQLDALRRTFSPYPLPVGRAAGPAWQLTVLPGSVDLDEAAVLVERGRGDHAAGRADAAADAFRAALDLLDGQALEGLDGEPFSTERDRLTAWRAGLVWECLAAEVACDRTDRALPDLRDLVARYPLREDLWEWLVLAAARHEGRAAGLAAYHEAERHLRRALGAAPGPALQAVRARVLAGRV